MKKALHYTLRAAFGLGALMGVGAIVSLASAFLLVIGGFGGNAQLPADCGLVFGAAVYGYDRPGPALARRIATAARLYNEGQVKTLILTGGVGRGGGVSLSEASVMRTQAIAYGVKVFDIRTEDASHSTIENLTFSRELAKDCKSIVGISDAFHLTRIRMLAFRQGGWDHFTVHPADDRPTAASEMKSVVREVFAFLYYGLYFDTIFGDSATTRISLTWLASAPGAC
jgi:vancomycin permeability regulator SanA